MFGQQNPEQFLAEAKEKVADYRHQADLERQLPRQAVPLRRRIARRLRAWAEALEPTPSFSRTHKRLNRA